MAMLGEQRGSNLQHLSPAHAPPASLTTYQIAEFYDVQPNQTKTIIDGANQDYLVSITCNCDKVDDLVAYFYNTSYLVRPDDTFDNVNNSVYSGQAIKH